MHCCLGVLFFFFKQKTAYEMRISDWSSDVCSSDLIYVSPNQVRKFGLRTGDTVEGEVRGPKEGERYFALTKLTAVNFDEPDAVRHRVNFDNLTPLYPDEKLRLDTLDPTVKDKSARVIDIISPQGTAQRALIVAPPLPGKKTGSTPGRDR